MSADWVQTRPAAHTLRDREPGLVTSPPFGSLVAEIVTEPETGGCCAHRRGDVPGVQCSENAAESSGETRMSALRLDF